MMENSNNGDAKDDFELSCGSFLISVHPGNNNSESDDRSSKEKQQGHGIVKSWKEIQEFDATLRKELFNSETGTVAIISSKNDNTSTNENAASSSQQDGNEEANNTTNPIDADGIFLPPLSRNDKENDALLNSIREWMENILRLPQAVQSKALTQFWTIQQQKQDQSKNNSSLEYIEYLLPNIHQDVSLKHFYRLGPQSSSFISRKLAPSSSSSLSSLSEITILLPQQQQTKTNHCDSQQSNQNNNTSSIASIIPISGSWLVWALELDHATKHNSARWRGIIVELSVFLVYKNTKSSNEPNSIYSDSHDGNTEQEQQQSQQHEYLVQEQDIELIPIDETSSNTTPKPYYFGSFRFPDIEEEQKGAHNSYSNNTPQVKLLLRQKHPSTLSRKSLFFTKQTISMWFECSIVPHAAFVAACTAASDQNLALERRRQAPMLNILYESHHVDVSVEPFVETAPDQVDVASWEQDQSPSCTSPIRLAFEQEQQRQHQQQQQTEQQQKQQQEILDLRNQVELMEIDFSALQTEHKACKSNLQLLQQEKRVWTVARHGIQTELVKLSQALASSQQECTMLQSKVRDYEAENRELRGLVKFWELTQEEDHDEESSKTEGQHEEHPHTNDKKATNRRHSDSLATVAKIKEAGRNSNGTKKPSKETKRLHDTNEKLQKALATKTDETDKLKRKVETLSKALRDWESKNQPTASDSGELQMNQKILEGKVRQLEQELQRHRNSSQQTRKDKNHKRTTTPPPTIIALHPSSQQQQQEQQEWIYLEDLPPEIRTFKLSNTMLHQQLEILIDRYDKLKSVLQHDLKSTDAIIKSNQHHRNVEIYKKLKVAIFDLVGQEQQIKEESRSF